MSSLLDLEELKGKIILEDNSAQFKIKINDRIYGLCVDGYSVKDYKWLVEILTKNFVDLYNRTKNDSKLKYQNDFRDLIGLDRIELPF